MAISVPCPACGKKLKTPDKLAGKRVTCPACKKSLAVPAASAMPSLAPQAPKKTSPLPEAERQDSPLPIFTFASVAVPVAFGLASVLATAYLLAGIEESPGVVILRSVGFFILPSVALGILIGISIRRARLARFKALIATGDLASVKELLALAFPTAKEDQMAQAWAQGNSVVVQKLLKEASKGPALLVKALLAGKVELPLEKQVWDLASPSGVELVVAALKHELREKRKQAGNLLKRMGWQPASTEQHEQFAAVEAEAAAEEALEQAERNRLAALERLQREWIAEIEAAELRDRTY